MPKKAMRETFRYIRETHYLAHHQEHHQPAVSIDSNIALRLTR
jgi:hypothetical protein